MDDGISPDKFIQPTTELTIYLLTRALKLYDLAVGWITDYLNLP